MIKKFTSVLVLSTALVSSSWSASDLAAPPEQKIQQARQFIKTRDSAKEVTYWNDYQEAKRRDKSLTAIDYVYSIVDTKPEAAGWFMVAGGNKGFANRKATEDESRKMHEVIKKLASRSAKTEDAIPVFAKAMVKSIIVLQKQSLTKGLEVYEELAKQHDSPYQHLQGVLDAVDKLNGRIEVLEKDKVILNARIVTHQGEINKLKEKVGILKGKNKNLESELDQLKIDHDVLKGDHDVLKGMYQNLVKNQEDFALQRLNEINGLRTEWAINLKNEVDSARIDTMKEMMPFIDRLDKRSSESDKRFFRMIDEEKAQRLEAGKRFDDILTANREEKRQLQIRVDEEKRQLQIRLDKSDEAAIKREGDWKNERLTIEEAVQNKFQKKKNKILKKLDKLIIKEQEQQINSSAKKEKLSDKLRLLKVQQKEQDATVESLRHEVNRLKKERDDLHEKIARLEQNVSDLSIFHNHANDDQNGSASKELGFLRNQTVLSERLQMNDINHHVQFREIDDLTIQESKIIQGAPNLQNRFMNSGGSKKKYGDMTIQKSEYTEELITTHQMERILENDHDSSVSIINGSH